MRLRFPLALALFLSMVMAVAVLYGQTPDNQTKDNQPKGNMTGVALQDYNPVSLIDPRFQVKNVNFDRRYASNGRGEFLDVVFDVWNLTSEPVDLIAFVLAFYETDAIDRKERTVVPYPSWRINDPAKSDFLVHYITITPQDIKDEDVWSKDDAEYKHYARIIERMRLGVAATEPIADVHPPLWKYLAHISNNPTKGLEFRLFGDLGPAANEVLQSNYIPPTPEEVKSRLHKTLPLHKYTLEHNRKHTSFRSHHYSNYRADFKFFNMVSILLFDAKLAKEGKGPNSLVYKQTFKMVRELRNF